MVSNVNTMETYQTVHNVPVYCENCLKTVNIALTKDDLPKQGSSGLSKKALVHGDHILEIEIDANGVVRNEKIVDIIFNPLDSLVSDVAQGFLFLNAEVKSGEKIIIDTYTSNKQLTTFFQKLISNIFSTALNLSLAEGENVTASTTNSKTVLKFDSLDFSVGPYYNIENTEYCIQRGLILDIEEAEKNTLDIESLIVHYNWLAVITPKAKYEGYVNAIASFLQYTNIPFTINKLSDSGMKKIFDFVLAIAFQQLSLIY